MLASRFRYPTWMGLSMWGKSSTVQLLRALTKDLPRQDNDLRLALRQLCYSLCSSQHTALKVLGAVSLKRGSQIKLSDRLGHKSWVPHAVTASLK